MTARDFTMEGGGKAAILLLHGLTGAPAEMHPLGRLLNRQGFTVHAPLLAGHGGHSHDILKTGWREWTKGAEDAYDRLARDHQHVYAGGICLGAMLAVALAARRSVTAIAAYGTTFRYDGWTMPRAASNRLLVKLGGGLPVIRKIGFCEREPYGLKDEGVRSFVIRAQLRANGGKPDSFPLGAVRQLYLLADHVDKTAPSIRSPALILHAREDDTSSPANAERLQNRLGGPARLELLNDSYHMIHLDREMQRVATLTAEFFHDAQPDVRPRA